MAKIIVVTSGKGGVGKTSLTALLGSYLAKEQNKVLLADGDFGLRNLDLVLGLENDILFDAYDLCKGHCKTEDALLKVQQYLDFLPASQQNRWDDGGKKRFRRLLKELGKFYDYIIVDGPAGISKGVESLLEVADEVLVVVSPQWSSLRDGERVMRLCNDKRFFNYATVINSMPLQEKQRLLSMEEVGHSLPAEHVGTVLPECEAIRQLAHVGQLHHVELLPVIEAMLKPLAHYIMEEEALPLVELEEQFNALPLEAKEGKKESPLEARLKMRQRQSSWRSARLR